MNTTLLNVDIGYKKQTAKSSEYGIVDQPIFLDIAEALCQRTEMLVPVF